MKEFIIWGKSPKNPDNEQILFNKAKTSQQAKNVIKVLKTKHNCFDVRLQVIDINKAYDIKSDFIGGIV
jgi:hypothetical protein